MTVRWNPEAATRKVRNNALAGVVAATELVADASVQNIQEGPKTGRIYRRRGTVHQASAPGESPASDTGRLLASRQTDIDNNALAGTVSYNTEYARRLELGDEEFPARPFLRKALDENESEVKATIQSFINGG